MIDANWSYGKQAEGLKQLLAALVLREGGRVEVSGADLASVSPGMQIVFDRNPMTDGYIIQVVGSAKPLPAVEVAHEQPTQESVGEQLDRWIPREVKFQD